MTSPSPTVQQLASLLDGLLDPFFAVDANWRYTFVNRHAAAIMGRTPEELLGRVLWDAFPEALDTRLDTEYRRVMRERVVREFELHYPSLGVWVEVRAFPHEDGLAVHFRDVTDRKLAEERREHLLGLTRVLADADDEDGLVRAFLDAARVATTAERGLVLLRDEGETSDRAWRSGEPDGPAGATLDPDEAGPVARALDADEPVFVRARDLAAGPNAGDAPRALAALPLGTGGRVLGALALHFDRDRTFNAAERDFLAALAAQFSLALDRVRLARTARLDAERDAFLAQASDLLSGAITPGATLDRLVSLAVPRLADWCGVYLPHGDTIEVAAVAHSDPGKVGLLWDVVRRVPMRADDLGGAPEIIRTGRVNFLPVITDAMLAALERDPVQTEFVRSIGLRSALGVPLEADGRVIGALQLVHAESGRRFTPDDIPVARDLARRAALALENARHREEARAWNATLERTVEERTRELAARTRALEAFADLTRDLAVETDPVRLVRRAQEILLTLLPSGMSGYFELRGDRWDSLSVVGPLPDDAFAAAVQWGLARGATRMLDVPHDTNTALYQDRFEPNPQHFPPESLRRLRSTASFPVDADSGTRGVLAVSLYEQHGWTPADKVVLETAVAQLGLALERANALRAVAARTAQLERANEELEAFSYTVSHDLRAPVRHLLSFAGVLRRVLGEDLTERAARPLGQIEASARRMNELIDALLAFAQSSRQAVRWERVNLEELTSQAIQDLHLDLGGPRVRWELGALPDVWGDAALLRQVMVNLLGNAVKYSATRDEAVVAVQARATPEGVVVSVRDNGVGFDERFADQLFGVFRRLHRADEFEGVGIGLATVRRIVERHGGAVWAEGRPGEGATFSFRLPDAP